MIDCYKIFKCTNYKNIPSRSEALDKDYSALQEKIRVADIQVQVGDDSNARDILATLNRIETELRQLKIEQEEMKAKMCCTIS